MSINLFPNELFLKVSYFQQRITFISHLIIMDTTSPEETTLYPCSQVCLGFVRKLEFANVTYAAAA
jgi:hypothetical protein